MCSKQKRFIALFLSVFTLSMNVATAEVQAESIQNDAITDILVAVGGVICTETALAYALGALGFTAASVAVYDNRDSLINWCENVKADFVDFCAKSKEWADVTSAKVQNWLEGIGTGVLDKADETWLALKDFCVDIFNKQKENDISGVDPSINFDNVITVNNFETWYKSEKVQKLVSLRGSKSIAYKDLLSNVQAGQQLNEISARFWGTYYDENEEMRKYNKITAPAGTDVVAFQFTDDFMIFAYSTQTLDNFRFDDYSTYPFATLSDDSYNLSKFSYILNVNDDDFLPYCGYRWWSFNNLGDKWRETSHDDIKVYKINCSRKELVGSGFAVGLETALIMLATGIYHGYADWDISIPQDDGISEEESAGYVVDGSVEDVIERDGTLDNVDVVNPTDVENDKVQVDVEGVTIQDISKPFPDDRTITIDDVGDVVLPDKKPVPKPTDNTDVKDYTLTGIQEVFPFCVPWDFYLLVKTLSAEPKAPKFEWTITYYDRKKKKEEKLEIDFSMFDSVAKVLRTMELLAFIIFLTLKTRNLIKG